MRVLLTSMTSIDDEDIIYALRENPPHLQLAGEANEDSVDPGGSPARFRGEDGP